MKETSKPVRLKKRKQFVFITDHGARYAAAGLVMQICPNKTQGIRIGFTVTKRLGCAVIRNRIRRRLREVVRLSPDIPQMGGYDLVFIGRQAAENRSFEQLKKDLAYVVRQARQDKVEVTHAAPPISADAKKLISAIRQVVAEQKDGEKSDA